MDAAEMLRSNQPIVQLRSKLSEEMFGSLESSDSTQQWYYFTKSLFFPFFQIQTNNSFFQFSGTVIIAVR